MREAIGSAAKVSVAGTAIFAISIPSTSFLSTLLIIPLQNQNQRKQRGKAQKLIPVTREQEMSGIELQQEKSPVYGDLVT